MFSSTVSLRLVECKSNNCWLFAMSLEHEMLHCTIFTLDSLLLKVFCPSTATELEAEHKISKWLFSYCTGVEVSTLLLFINSFPFFLNVVFHPSSETKISDLSCLYGR